MARNTLYCSDCCEVLKRLCISQLLSSTITSVTMETWRHVSGDCTCRYRKDTAGVLRMRTRHAVLSHPLESKQRANGAQLSNARSKWALVCLGTTFSNQFMTLNPGGKSKGTCLCKSHERRRIVFHRDLDI